MPRELRHLPPRNLSLVSMVSCQCSRTKHPTFGATIPKVAQIYAEDFPNKASIGALQTNKIPRNEKTIKNNQTHDIKTSQKPRSQSIAFQQYESTNDLLILFFCFKGFFNEGFFATGFTPSDQGILVIHREDWLSPTSGRGWVGVKPPVFSWENLGIPHHHLLQQECMRRNSKVLPSQWYLVDSKHQHHHQTISKHGNP